MNPRAYAFPLHGIDAASSPKTNAELYGTNKAIAESVVQEIYGERGLIVRPGLIVGPYDNLGRLIYWIDRIARGGEVLAPDRPELPVQFIDARDLVQWVYQIALVQQTRIYQTRIYNAVGPDYPLILGQVLKTCQQVTGSNAAFTWVPGSFLESQGVQHWTELPLWLPPSLQNTFPCLNNYKAVADGLRFRSLAETIKDTWQWSQAEQPTYPSGLSQIRENAILQAWHEQS